MCTMNESCIQEIYRLLAMVNGKEIVTTLDLVYLFNIIYYEMSKLLQKGGDERNTE